MSHHDKRIKLLAITYYKNENISQEKIAEVFGINRRTFQRWYYLYLSEKSLDRKEREYYSYKTKKKHVVYSLKLIKKYPHISIPKLWQLMKKKYKDFTITQEHLGVVIRDNNITRKRTAKRHYPETKYGKKVDLKKQLSLFYRVIDKYSIQNIICIDETPISGFMKPYYSRCNLGKRCVMKTSNNKVFTKYSLVMAINTKGIVGWILYKKGGMTGIRMVEFLNKFIIGKFQKNLIIMDNAGSHKNSIVKECIMNSSNKIHFTVPYRPKTNAIETYFSIFKHYMIQEQGDSITYDEIRKTITKALQNIKKSSYKNIFEYAYLSKEIRKVARSESTWKRPEKKYKN